MSSVATIGCRFTAKRYLNPSIVSQRFPAQQGSRGPPGNEGFANE